MKETSSHKAFTVTPRRLSNALAFLARLPNTVENSPIAPAVAVGDLVTIQVGVPSRNLTGYVASIDCGAARMHYGPVFPISAVSRFVQRHGAPIPKGTQSLPSNGF